MTYTVALRECNHCCRCSKCSEHSKVEAFRLTDKVFQQLVKQYGEPVGEGRDRIVFDRGDGWVVKFPKDCSGWNANWREARRLDNDRNSDKLAMCYIEVASNGTPLLYMEEVNRLSFQDMSFEEAEAWITENAPWAIDLDAWQIGYNSEGRLVAYDYAD